MICYAEIQSSSPEFTKGYKELVKVRANLKKAEESYDKKMLAHDNSLASFCIVEEDMQALKEKLEEVRAWNIMCGVWLCLARPVPWPWSS